MYNLKELKSWLLENGYATVELSEDQLGYFMDTHAIYNEGKYNGKVCKFTGTVYGLRDYVFDDPLVGYLTVYKTATGRKVFDRHRL